MDFGSRVAESTLRREASLFTRRLLWDLKHRLGDKGADKQAEQRRIDGYESVSDINAAGSRLTDIFNSEEVGFIITNLTGSFKATYQRQIDWLIERLKVSTAGYRGLVDIQELLQITNAITTEMTAHLDRVAAERGYKEDEKNLVNLAVIMFVSQGVADWINANFHPGERRVFIGNDVRFQSKEAAELTARVFLANGIEVFMDTAEHTATPVTSYMAYWLNTRQKVSHTIARLILSDRLLNFLEKRKGRSPFIAFLLEESGGAMFGLIRPLHNRVRRWIFGSAGAMQKTSSHNPPGENGEKVSDREGGVAPDDVTSGQAKAISSLMDKGKCIRIAPKRDLAKVHYVDAKRTYWDNYVRYAFPKAALEKWAEAITGGKRYMFDGLQGVGGETFEYLIRRLEEEILGQPGALLKGIILTNKEPSPMLGRIAFPDPTRDSTVDLSGDLQKLADDLNIRCFVLADADADRTGVGVRIVATGGGPAAQSPEVQAARRLGLFVSILKTAGGAEVPVIRFTANQLYAMLAFTRCLDYIKEHHGIDDMKKAVQAVKDGSIQIPNSVFLTTIPSSRLLAAVAGFFGGEIITTAVGFKYLGAQTGKYEDRSTKLSHHDKDTSVIASYLFALDADLSLQGKNMLDLYKLMADQLGALLYYDREDIYFRDNAHKEEIMRRALVLESPSQADQVAKIFGKTMETVEADVEIAGTFLMDEVGEEFKEFQPRGYRVRFKDETYMEVFHAGAKGKDGPCFTMYDKNGKIIFWTVLRQSGTEPLGRLYTEISENPEDPHPEHLITYFHGLANYLELPQGADSKKGGIRNRINRILDRYCPELKVRIASEPYLLTIPSDQPQSWNNAVYAMVLGN